MLFLRSLFLFYFLYLTFTLTSSNVGYETSTNQTYRMLLWNGNYRIINPQTTRDLLPFRLRHQAFVLLAQENNFSVFRGWRIFQTFSLTPYKMFGLQINASWHFLQVVGRRSVRIKLGDFPYGTVERNDSRLFKVETLLHNYYTVFQHVKSGGYLTLRQERLTTTSMLSLAVDLVFQLQENV